MTSAVLTPVRRRVAPDPGKEADRFRVRGEAEKEPKPEAERAEALPERAEAGGSRGAAERAEESAERTEASPEGAEASPERAEASPEVAEASPEAAEASVGGAGAVGRAGCERRHTKMADGEEVTLDGRPLHLLRVADLKAALEQRGLAKSGQKSALVKRLRGVRGRRGRAGGGGLS